MDKLKELKYVKTTTDKVKSATWNFVKDESGSTRLPDWLKKRFQAGEDFNRANRARYPHNEVEVTVDGKKFRVDSYDPTNREIVARRFTQFANVKADTAVAYFSEFARKYPVGAEITNSPFNARTLQGQRLRGKMIFEVPVQQKPIPQAVLDAAKQRRIIIEWHLSFPNGLE